MNPQRQKKLEQQDVFISCIVPVLNEAELLGQFLTALHQELTTYTKTFEILVVNDGSTDQTEQVVKEFNQQHPQIKCISFSRNFGKEQAIAAGLKHVSGEVAIILDADFQHPFHYFKTFLAHWAQGYDNVYGVRINRHDEGLLKRGFTNVFYNLLNRVSEVKIPPDAGDYRLLDRSAIDALNQCPEHSRFMKGLYAWVGFKSIGVPYQPDERKQGKSRWKFGSLTKLAVNGMLSFSSAPLRLCSIFGLTISILAIIYGIYVVMRTLMYGNPVAGYPTIVASIFFLGGIQLISIGILGEYISKIFTEVKQRPNYIIENTTGLEQDD